MLHTTITTEDKKTAMRYHETKIAEWDRDNNIVTLNTGGWETPTTKRRMNQFSDQLGLSYKVYQRAGEWYVDVDNTTLQFINNTVQFEVN